MKGTLGSDWRRPEGKEERRSGNSLPGQGTAAVRVGCLNRLDFRTIPDVLAQNGTESQKKLEKI